MTRVASGAGVLFAVLSTAGLLMQAVAYGGAEDESRGEVVARYSDGGNELWAEVGGLLIGLGIAFALPFLAGLGATLRSAEGERARFATVALAGGVVMAVMLATASVCTVAAFSSYDFYEAYDVDPDVVLLTQSLSFSALGYALVGGGVLVGATSVVALRSRLLPGWLAGVGLALAFVCLFGEWALILFVPLPLLFLWTLVVALLLITREPRGGGPSGATRQGRS